MSEGYYTRKLVEITVLRYCLVLFLQPSNQYHYCKGSLDSAQWSPQGEVSNNVAVKVIIQCGNYSSGLRELYFILKREKNMFITRVVHRSYDNK